MKRIGNLYNSITTIENLKLADYRAQKGKKKQKDVIKHNLQQEENINKLYSTLVEENYKTSKYHNFVIKEPKSRKISRLSYYPNRILHWAVFNVIERILTGCLISQTYSCIRGRGIHLCLKKVRKAVQKDGFLFCLKIDISKFYECINHDILKWKLERKFKDRKLLSLLHEIIDSFPNGLPLGSLLSQHLANFYLNGFDHWIKQDKRVEYHRYCDDAMIFHNDKAFLHSLKREIEEYLYINLGLTLSKWQTFPLNKRGVDIVGYVVYPTHVLLRKSIKQRWKKILKKNRNLKSIASYNGWLIHSNSINLRNKYLCWKNTLNL